MYARRRPLGTEDSAFEPVKDEDQSAVARPQIAALGGQLTAVTLNEGGQQPVRVFEPRVVASRPSVQTRRPRAPRATLSPMSAPEGSTLHDSTTLRNRSERDKSTMGAHSTSATAGDHPFLSTGFKASLMSAGYTEMIDVSRKKIKARFTHACGKLEFKTHLHAFLDEMGLTTRGEYMVRFVGTQNVHSPYIHLFVTTSIAASDSKTVKIVPEIELCGSTLWTYLRSEDGASHWSCRRAKFWPVRVVLEGPALSSAATRPRIDTDVSRSRKQEDGSDDLAKRRELELNTQKNSEHVNHPKRKVVEPDPPATSEPSSPHTPHTPTVLESVRQLGAAVVATIPPRVGETVHQQYVALRRWVGRGSSDHGPHDEAEEDVEVRLDREARRERRRRRQARRAEEEMELAQAEQAQERRRRREQRNRASRA